MLVDLTDLQEESSQSITVHF